MFLNRFFPLCSTSNESQDPNGNPEATATPGHEPGKATVAARAKHAGGGGHAIVARASYGELLDSKCV